MDPGRPAPGVLGIATLQITQIPFEIDQFGGWGNGAPGRHSSRSILAPHQRAAPAMPPRSRGGRRSWMGAKRRRAAPPMLPPHPRRARRVPPLATVPGRADTRPPLPTGGMPPGARRSPGAGVGSAQPSGPGPRPRRAGFRSHTGFASPARRRRCRTGQCTTGRLGRCRAQ